MPKVGVEMGPNRVMNEMVLDGGGHFIPAGIFGLPTLSLLLTSQAAHDRATEDTRTHIQERNTHTGKERYTIRSKPDTHLNTLNVGTVHKLKQGGINSVPL